MRNAVVSLLVLSLVACESSGGPSATSSATSSAPKLGTSASAATEAKGCEKAEALRKRLSTIDVKVSRVGIPSDFVLPSSSEGVTFPVNSALVVVNADGYTVDGKKLTKASEIQEGLRLNTVLFAVGKDDKDLKRLEAGVTALKPETTVYLLAAVPDATREPMPKGMKLDLPTSERAVELAQALSKAIDDCKPATKIFQSLATEDPDGRAPKLREKLPAAFDSCQCKVSDDAVDLVAYLLGGDAPVVAKRLVLTKDKAATAIDLKDKDGQKLYDALPKDGSPVRF